MEPGAGVEAIQQAGSSAALACEDGVALRQGLEERGQGDMPSLALAFQDHQKLDAVLRTVQECLQVSKLPFE
jgi:hypothetical protein